MKGKHGEGYVTGGVPKLRECVVPFRRPLVTYLPPELWVVGHGLRNLLAYRAEVSSTDKQDNSSPRVAPREIPQDLIDSAGECLGTVPYLTLTDEKIAVILPDQDIRLSGHVEGFACGASLKLGVKRCKEDGAQVFLTEGTIGARGSLHA